MDPLTHAVTGATIGQSLTHKPLSRGLLLWLALVGMAPDLDYVLLFISDVAYLKFHRGITHSLLMLPLWCWLFHWLTPNRLSRQLRHLSPIIALVLLSHIILDLTTSFGTMIWSPLSGQRLSWDLLFIIDPLFTACLLLPLLLGLKLKRFRHHCALVGLALGTLYIGLAAVQHQQAIELARTEQPDALEHAALPLPFSPFHWRLIAVQPESIQHAAIDLRPECMDLSSMFPVNLIRRLGAQVDTTGDLHWHSLIRLINKQPIPEQSALAFYLWFARFPVLLDKEPDYVEYGDLRFGAGVPGSRAPFRLRISRRGVHSQAWLIWSDQRITPLPLN
ncbi:MAG: metal-dependent hydrolase [Zetaproteobacteria bacterium]|nr:MAG: metal-dependent hydrolase [Zetaproteobacteria bacterium]